jgi:hypothetical protein
MSCQRPPSTKLSQERNRKIKKIDKNKAMRREEGQNETEPIHGASSNHTNLNDEGGVLNKTLDTGEE